MFCPAGSPSPPPTKLKKLKKKGEVEYFAAEEAAAIPVSPSGTDDELREAFEEVEQEKELQELEEVPQKKVAVLEDEVSFGLRFASVPFLFHFFCSESRSCRRKFLLR